MLGVFISSEAACCNESIFDILKYGYELFLIEIGFV